MPLEHEGISQADLDRVQEIIRLRIVNAKLLIALELAARRIEVLLVGKKDHSQHPWVREARDAIQEAKK